MAVLPMGKWLLPTVRQRFVCDRSSKVKLLSGNFYGFTKEQMIIAHDSYRGKFYGLISYEILRTT